MQLTLLQSRVMVQIQPHRMLQPLQATVTTQVMATEMHTQQIRTWWLTI